MTMSDEHRFRKIESRLKQMDEILSEMIAIIKRLKELHNEEL